MSLLWLVLAGTSLAAGPSPLLLPAAGVLTAIPLVLFAAAAKRVRYSDLGLIQYLAPTLQLILAVALYGEVITRGQWIAFGVIWAGAGDLRDRRDADRAARGRRHAGIKPTRAGRSASQQ